VNDLGWAISPDGLTIRPLTAADRAALATLPGRVSPQSAIGRFHGALNRLTDPLLDWLPDLEPGRHEALVAADELGIAGIARFIRDEDASSTAEVAIIIADDWQHQGVARLMLDRLKLR
jgi:hypothetical protein